MVKPKKKKQQPRNALYYFADTELRKQFREEGRPMPSIQELIAIAHPRFQQLSEEEQLRWKATAKREKDKLRKDMTNVFTATGQSVAELMEEKARNNRNEMLMKDDIKTTVTNHIARNTILKHKFYVLDFNTYVVTDEDPKEYVPAEISVVEFSLGKGITNKFIALIAPGHIPRGYMAQAMEETDQTHKLKMNSPNATDNYIGLIIRLRNFINPNEEKAEYPPFYVMPEHTEKCNYILEWLYERCDDRRRSPFKVYSLPYLLFCLQSESPKSKAGDTRDENSLAAARTNCEDVLERSTFDYTEGIECEWHCEMAKDDEDLQVIYCVQSRVISKIYLLLDSCLQYYNVTLIANQHCPEAPKESAYKTVPVKSSRSRSEAADSVNEWRIQSALRSPGSDYSCNASETTFGDGDTQVSQYNYNSTQPGAWADAAALRQRALEWDTSTIGTGMSQANYNSVTPQSTAWSNAATLRQRALDCDTSTIGTGMLQANYNSVTPQPTSPWGVCHPETKLDRSLEEEFPDLHIQKSDEMKASKSKSKRPKQKSQNQVSHTGFPSDPPARSAGRGIYKVLMRKDLSEIRPGMNSEEKSSVLASTDFPALGSLGIGRGVPQAEEGSLGLNSSDFPALGSMGKGRASNVCSPPPGFNNYETTPSEASSTYMGNIGRGSKIKLSPAGPPVALGRSRGIPGKQPDTNSYN